MNRSQCLIRDLALNDQGTPRAGFGKIFTVGTFDLRNTPNKEKAYGFEHPNGHYYRETFYLNSY